MQPFQNPHRIQWHVTVDAFVSHIDRSFIFSIKRSNFVIFKILLHENSIFNNPELPFSFFRRQFTKKFELCIWILETPFIYRLFRGMENRAFITFVALFGFPQIVAGIVEMLLIVFFFFLFFLHEAGQGSFYSALSFSPVETNRTEREWQGRDPLRGSTALPDEFMRDIRAGNSVPWIVWQLCGFRAQRFSTVQRLNPVDSYYAGMKYAATI